MNKKFSVSSTHEGKIYRDVSMKEEFIISASNKEKFNKEASANQKFAIAMCIKIFRMYKKNFYWPHSVFDTMFKIIKKRAPICRCKHMWERELAKP
jgi:hypothetical protein